MKQRIPTWDQFLNENSSEIPHKRNKWFEVNPKYYDSAKDDFFNLIQTAYKEIGGHAKIKSSDDVFIPDYNYWIAIDIDNDPDIDIVRGYKTTQFGYKSVVVGHDGSKQAKDEYIQKQVKDLKTKGMYAEVSHKLAALLIDKYKVHVVTNPHSIQAVIGKPIEFHGNHPDGNMPGDGWYTRKIGGGSLTKILVGMPIITESVSDRPTLLVLHGYESSQYPDRLKKISNEYNLITPPMDYDNNKNLFKDTVYKINGMKVDMIVGSSMGGYFGYYIAKKLNIPALLFNPAVIETNSGIKRQTIDMTGKNSPKIYVVSGNNDSIVEQDKLESWLKENASNYIFIKENFGHQVPDDLYIRYIKKLVK